MVVPSAPVFAFIQLTADCNNRCPGCSNAFLDDPNERRRLASPLSSDQWETVFRKLKPYVTQLRITGGEPSLHPAFGDVLGRISALGIPFVVFTNARWHDPRQFVEVAKANEYWKSILVSLHGATATAHEAFSQVPGSFEETVRNVRYALGKGLRVHTNTVITRQNFDQIERIYKFARSLGVQRVVVARYVGESVDGVTVTEDQLKQAIRKVDEMRKEGAQIRHSGCVPQCFVASGAYGCTAGYTFFTVDPWGNVSPCNHAPATCGSLLEQSVTEVWQSPPMREWRRSVPDECEKCVAYLACHGGCRAAAYGAGSARDPLMGGRQLAAVVAQGSEQITLTATAKPLLCCQLRPEPFGYLLIRGARSLPVSRQAKGVIDACDGQTSLLEIQERFGQGGLDLIGLLGKRGFVRLRHQ